MRRKNITEWTGMEFGDSLRAAEDRKRWKGIVAINVIYGAPTTAKVKGLRWEMKCIHIQALYFAYLTVQWISSFSCLGFLAQLSQFYVKGCSRSKTSWLIFYFWRLVVRMQCNKNMKNKKYSSFLWKYFTHCLGNSELSKSDFNQIFCHAQ